jgi:hypothetical protein
MATPRDVFLKRGDVSSSAGGAATGSGLGIALATGLSTGLCFRTTFFLGERAAREGAFLMGFIFVLFLTGILKLYPITVSSKGCFQTWPSSAVPVNTPLNVPFFVGDILADTVLSIASSAVTVTLVAAVTLPEVSVVA